VHVLSVVFSGHVRLCEYKQETVWNILLNEILKGFEILSFLVNSADAESEFNSEVKEIALMVQFPVDTVQ